MGMTHPVDKISQPFTPWKVQSIGGLCHNTAVSRSFAELPSKALGVCAG